jgi:hypothetical protein
LPADCEEKVSAFNARLRKCGENEYAYVVCADETFVLQEASGADTYETRGARTVAVRSFAEKKGCTVMLAGAAALNPDGTYTVKPVTPFIIFKGGSTILKKLVKLTMYSRVFSVFFRKGLEGQKAVDGASQKHSVLVQERGVIRAVLPKIH